MVSGGMDSIYATYDRVAHSDDQVTLVHFDLRPVWGETSEKFTASQRWATQAAARWISRNLRPVELIIVPVKQYRANGWWATELIFWGADHCSAGQFDEVITGWCGENFSPHRAQLLRRLQKAIFARYASRGTLAYPLERITKVEMIAAMPSELRCLSMSCHEPEVIDDRAYACGVCRKCSRNNYLMAMIASGLPKREIRAKHLENIAATPHHDGKGYREVYAKFEMWDLVDDIAPKRRAGKRAAVGSA